MNGRKVIWWKFRKIRPETRYYPLYKDGRIPCLDDGQFILRDKNKIFSYSVWSLDIHATPMYTCLLKGESLKNCKKYLLDLILRKNGEHLNKGRR
jgi:hypothetical protein